MSRRYRPTGRPPGRPRKPRPPLPAWLQAMPTAADHGVPLLDDLMPPGERMLTWAAFNTPPLTPPTRKGRKRP